VKYPQPHDVVILTRGAGGHGAPEDLEIPWAVEIDGKVICQAEGGDIRVDAKVGHRQTVTIEIAVSRVSYRREPRP